MIDKRKKKILVRVWEPVAVAINRDLRANHIRRDSYLNDLLAEEIERLDKEIDFMTPDGARKRIKRRLLDLKPEPMTLVLDKSLVKRLSDVLKKKNIDRGPFINRVLFFLIAKPKLLEAINVNFTRRIETLVKPLSEISSNMVDPFFNIRCANDDHFYTLPIRDAAIASDVPNLFGLNCAIRADDWALMNTNFDDLFEGLLEIGA